MKKGISLIVLVITIIVVIVLAAVVIISLNNAGIFSSAKEATFKSDMKNYMHEYAIYAASYVEQGNKLEALNVSGSDIHTVITSIPSNLAYKNRIKIVNGQLMYDVDVRDKEDVERAVWACEVGMTVEGVTNCTDIQYTEIHSTSYEKVGNIYYNTPDITGFNLSTTYFVTYDSNGNEIIGTNLEKTAPANWHDYANKQWANVVSINGDAKLYLVWIPRYAYKVDSAGKVVDVRFVTTDNVYTAPDGTKTTYSDTTPTLDENGNQTNYVVSSAFTVDMSDENKDNIELAGFWSSKYEVSEPATMGTPVIDTLGDKIIIYTTTVSGSIGTKTFEYYLNDKLITTNTTGTYTFEGLTPNTSYNLEIVLKDGLVAVDSYSETIVTPGIPTYGEANAPDLTGFDLTKTYYLTYNESDEEVRTQVMVDGVQQAAPSGWYDYSAKKWANIVVVNETAGTELYLTWIPRYEYRVLAGSSTASEKTIDIAFIPKTKTVPTNGYIISSAFTVDMSDENKPNVELAGFWSSKYEVSDSAN